ncbi:phage tail protein [Vibrio cholerae]|uniref:phage tail protein n=1 Tax=Vibrio cholerae TaxID=666 RepID=UPI001A9CDE85|nr:phage tail protein [Vibrio cholerae]MBO1366078.1 phage tail protein [Vibrio cholerae]MBO1370850.1 phage tail protein [Vibrio cholerae]MBO1374832.1 phage tail protein [Vibrio cholerae]MBO1378269.1 phage tail protein [Vibrio cholerae]MBO1406960.1 phage tail protein [Vibrio cholerae]
MHKLQNGSQVSVRPQRKPLVGLGGYFSESNEQGAPSYPGQDWFNNCIDEFINALDEMGISYDQEQLDHLARAFAAVRSQEWNELVNYGVGEQVLFSGKRYYAVQASGPDNGGEQQPDPSIVEYWFEIPSVGTRAFEFLSVPVGAEIAFNTPPPADDPRFRFVKLTADDAYNGSLLNNKTISGTAPNLVVKMTVNSALSPINGQQISMLNTMGAIPAPGLNSGEIIQDAIRNLTGFVNDFTGAPGVTSSGSFTTTFIGDNTLGGSSISKQFRFSFDASRQVPVANRVQVFAETKVYYKRIY